MFGSKKNKFTSQEFEKLAKEAKHQYILKTEKYVYFIALPFKSFFNDISFIGHNESTGTIDIVDYDKIKEVIVDGKKMNFD
jgi:hypothetical protein